MKPIEPAAESAEALLIRALAAETLRCGEVCVARVAGEGWDLRHYRDGRCPAQELAEHRNPEDAAEIARYTDAGEYRPLKGAPDLRRGWRLCVASVPAVRLALDLFYPGRLGAFLAFGAGRLAVTNFRETLTRQSGMYRVTQRLSDSQADALVGRFCRSDGGCLRTILWKRDAGGAAPSTELPGGKYDPGVDQSGGGVEGRSAWIPLLCQEACNLLVAEARRVVKGEIPG